MVSPRQYGMTAWGRVWSLGAKRMLGLGGRTFLQFVLRLPKTRDYLEAAPVRLWVHWYGYDPENWITAGDYLLIRGEPLAKTITERIGKDPIFNLILLVEGKEAVEKVNPMVRKKQTVLIQPGK